MVNQVEYVTVRRGIREPLRFEDLKPGELFMEASGDCADIVFLGTDEASAVFLMGPSRGIIRGTGLRDVVLRVTLMSPMLVEKEEQG